MTIKTRTVVGADGMVHVNLRVGEAHAGEEVEIALTSSEPHPALLNQPPHPENAAAHLAKLEGLHGCIDDPTFCRPSSF